MNVKFLTATACLDADGYHVWQTHDCTEGRVESMLPWPTWKAIAGKVEPSVNCGACGLHFFLEVKRREYKRRKRAMHWAI